MLKKLFNFIRGGIFYVLAAINLFFFCSLILFFSIFVFIIPAKKWRYYGTALLLKFPVYWMDVNAVLMLLNTFGKMEVKGSGELNPKSTYLMISNHRSWIDILVLCRAFHRKTPLMKFFMKRELLWSLPFAGLACYVLGYPFMHRHTKAEIRKKPELKGKDIETAKKACQKFKDHPSTVINFVEGTRFREHKRVKQNSPYQHLLKPKAAGAAVVLNELHHHLSGIINTTVDYEPKDLSFWDFACGNFNKIIIRYEVLPVTEELIGNYYQDRQFRAQFQQWLNIIWQQKEHLLASIKHQAANESKNDPNN